MKNTKKVLAALLAGGMLLVVSGCGSSAEPASSAASGTSSSTAAGVGDKIGNAMSAIGNEIKADGREHSKLYTAKDNEVMTNTFFEFNINSAEVVSTLEDYLPDDKSHAFLVLDMNIKNVFEDDASIPMFSSDFELSWAAVGESTVFSESNFGITGQLPDEWTQFKDSSKTGKLVFIVPNDVTEFDLIYREIYEDDFEGSRYTVTFTPNRSNYVELTEEEIAMIG